MEEYKRIGVDQVEVTRTTKDIISDIQLEREKESLENQIQELQKHLNRINAMLETR